MLSFFSRDEHLQAVSNLLQSEVGKDDPQSASFHSVFQQLFQNCLDTIFSPKSANEVQDDQQSGIYWFLLHAFSNLKFLFYIYFFLYFRVL